MYQLKKASSVFLFVFSLWLVSCTNQTEKKQDTVNNDTTNSVKNLADSLPTYYQIPAPSNLFNYLKDNGVKVSNVNFLNSVSKLKDYNSSSEKAVNFGVYSTDLFFCSSFNFKADVLKYFEVLKSLADELGLSNVVTDKTINRIESNLSKNDSLVNITSEVYNEAAFNLEKRNEGATLAMLVVGGWVECIYLSTKSVGTYQSNPKSVNIIAEQKLTVDNIKELLAQHAGNAQVASLTSKLKGVFEIYDRVDVKEISPTIQLTKGKREIGGSESYSFSEANFNELIKAIDTLRKDLTKN